MKAFLSFISRFDDTTPIDNGDGQPINEQQTRLVERMRDNLKDVLEPIHSDRFACACVRVCVCMSLCVP